MVKKSIFVKNFITSCLIGIYPNERKKKQKIKISVFIDIINVKNKDVISSTVSYERIITILNQIKNYKHINLLETLAKKIFNKMEEIHNLKKVKIEIVKCNILAGDQEVGITLEKLFKK